jgi:hypothetical protein
MQFTSNILAATALASIVAANSAMFVNQDGKTRHVVFTPSPGSSSLDSITVSGNSQGVQQFPQGWTGNAYTYNDGETDVAGILAEFCFDASGTNFFDVSAIVSPDATDGVMMMYPSGSQTPVSGCLTTSCTNQYNLPDDVATKATPQADFTVLLGQRTKSARRGMQHAAPRNFAG